MLLEQPVREKRPRGQPQGGLCCQDKRIESPKSLGEYLNHHNNINTPEYCSMTTGTSHLYKGRDPEGPHAGGDCVSAGGGRKG